MTSLILSLSGLLLRNSAEALIESSGPNATSAYATLPTPSKRSLRSSQLGPGSISNLEATSGQTENGRIAGRLSESPSVYKMTSSSRDPMVDGEQMHPCWIDLPADSNFCTKHKQRYLCGNKCTKKNRDHLIHARE